jgi:hypothetical protein
MSNHLTPDDYGQLAIIMAGPHGQPVTTDQPVDLLIVFSCADPEVGRTAARLYADKLIRRVVFSGNVGKDSGGLPALSISEATFLASVAINDGLPADAILLEEHARNGKENADFSLRLAAEKGLLTPGVHIGSLAPTQRGRRLYEELRYQAASYSEVTAISGLSSGTADPNDPDIQAELLEELCGLHTMHTDSVSRIFRQEEFQPDGARYELVERAGFVA